MIEGSLAEVLWRWRREVIEVVELFLDAGEAVGKLLRLLDIVAEPFLDGLDLVCIVDGDSAEGGRVKGSLLELDGHEV